MQGPPGAGKSALIEAMLASYGYKQMPKSSNNNTCQHNPLTSTEFAYVKLDASLPIEKKSEYIADAFDKGHALWIDEVNSCSDSGLENILNNALTGMHPYTGKSAKQAGFMALFTGNSVSLVGWQALSPALLHRSAQELLASPIFSEILMVLKSHYPEYEKDLHDGTALVNALKKINEELSPSQRKFIKKFKQAVDIYQPVQDNIETSTVCTRSTMSHC